MLSFVANHNSSLQLGLDEELASVFVVLVSFATDVVIALFVVPNAFFLYTQVSVSHANRRYLCSPEMLTFYALDDGHDSKDRYTGLRVA